MDQSVIRSLTGLFKKDKLDLEKGSAKIKRVKHRINLPTGRIVVGDVGEGGPVLKRKVPPGKYPVEAISAKWKKDRRIASVRILFSRYAPRSWKAAGEFSINSGCAAILDAKHYDDYYDQFEVLGDSEFQDLENADGVWAAPSNMGGAFIFLTGLGDGTYPLYWGLDKDGKIAQLITDLDLFKLDTTPPRLSDSWLLLLGIPGKAYTAKAKKGEPRGTKTQRMLADLEKADSDVAFEALKKMGDRAIPAVLEHFNSHPDPPEVLIQLLGEYGEKSESAVPRLIELFKKKDWEHEYTAIDALGMIHSKPELTLPFLSKYATSEEYIAETALEAIGKFGTKAKDAIPLILSRKYDPEDEEQGRLMARVACTLLSIDAKNKDVVKFTTQCLQELKAEDMTEIVECLQEIEGRARYVDSVIDALIREGRSSYMLEGLFSLQAVQAVEAMQPLNKKSVKKLKQYREVCPEERRRSVDELIAANS
jgi:hypothetical protein